MRVKTAGFLLIVLGILALLTPLVTGIAIAYLVGLLVLVAGVARLASAFIAATLGQGMWALVVGVVMIIGGVMMILHPLMNLTFLTLLIAAYFLVVGVVTVVGAFRMKPAAGWGTLFFSGAVSILLGGLIWSEWPLSGTWAIGILLGVQLLMIGIQMVGVASVLGAAQR